MTGEIRPEVVALWLGADILAASDAGRLVHRGGRPFTDAELDVAWSFTDDERAAVLEAAAMRVTEAEVMYEHEAAKGAARIAAADARVAAAEQLADRASAALARLRRADYRAYCRKRQVRRGRDRTRPLTPRP
ncbi:MAG: hypothetical protein ACRDOK_13150 [Streptosporangiaceae bacterium]